MKKEQESDLQIIKQINSAMPNFHYDSPPEGINFILEYWSVDCCNTNELLTKYEKYKDFFVGENNLIDSLKEVYGNNQTWYGDIVVLDNKYYFMVFKTN